MVQDIRLVKEMGYERIDCICGTAVLPKDPTPELSRMVKKIAVEEGLRFTIIDTSVHPEVVETYKISRLPVVIIGNNPFPVDEKIIREAIRKRKHDTG